MLDFLTNLLIVCVAAFLFVSVAMAEVDDELSFDSETEAGLVLDFNQEISKQEQQIEVILKALNSESQPEEVAEVEVPGKTLTVTLVSKKEL